MQMTLTAPASSLPSWTRRDSAASPAPGGRSSNCEAKAESHKLPKRATPCASTSATPIGAQSSWASPESLSRVVQGGLQFAVLLLAILEPFVQDRPFRFPLGFGAFVSLPGRRPEERPCQHHPQRQSK